MDYIIALKFIAWVIAIMIWSGFGLFKLFEYDINNPKSETKDTEKMALELIINNYNNANIAGRFMLICWLGTIVYSVIVESIFGRLIKKEKNK